MNHLSFCVRAVGALALSASTTTAIAQTRSIAKPVSEFVLQHVTIVDGTGAPPKSDMAVVVKDGTIQAIGKSAEVAVPTGATVVDVTGKFLIPGLWDMHVHCDNPRLSDVEAGLAERKAVLPAFLAHGVTSARDMGAEFRLLPDWREEIDAGNDFGPRLLLSGPPLDGENSPIPRALTCTDATQAAHILSKLKGRGADFVSVQSGLSQDAYLAVVDEAKKLGLAIAGSVPDAVTNARASDAGQLTLEQLSGMVRDCGDVEAARAKVKALDAEVAPHDAIATFSEALLATQDPAKERVMIERLAKNRTWVTPTLVALQRQAFFEEERTKLGDTFTNASRFLREASDEDTHPRLMDRTQKSMEIDRALFARSLALVSALHKGGVRLLAGTDACEAPLCLPGGALHEELALFVRAGLTPAEALQTATRNAAECAGLAHQLGTVQTGKLADLVLLDADPLADIKNVAKIDSVVVRGRLFSKPLLDRLQSRGQTRVSDATDK